MDPLKDIEDRQAQIDLGKMAGRVFIGALEETENWLMAYFATAAYFKSMFQSAPDEDNDS